MLRRRRSLGTLLRIRKRKEELEAQALADAHRDVDQATRQREALAREQQRALTRMGELSQGEFDASDVRRYHQHERYLAARGVDKDADIRALEAVREERRAALEEASKRKRVVEKLIERRTGAWRDHVARQEQRALDETASIRAALRRRGTEDMTE